MIKHSTRIMSYNTASKMFVVERSMLDQGGQLPIDCQVYDDACDAGFTLISHITGCEVIFTFKEYLRDDEGEAYAAVYSIDTKSARRYPALAGATVHVLNT